MPDLAQADANHRALVYAVACQQLDKGRTLGEPETLLAIGLDHLARSTLPGAAEAAAALRPPTRHARGSAYQLTASASQGKSGNPIFLAFPHADGALRVALGSETFIASDPGHVTDFLDGSKLEGQCVIKALAEVAGTAAADLWKALHEDALRREQCLPPTRDFISEHELHLRRVAHDLKRHGSHDLFLTRYLLPYLFETYRLIFVCASSSGQVSVQVVESPFYDPAADGACTRMILAYDGHAYVMHPPVRFLKGTASEDMSPAASQALLHHFESLGIPVTRYHHVSCDDIAQANRDIPTATLVLCPCCNDRLLDPLTTRAGFRATLPAATATGGVKTWVSTAAVGTTTHYDRPLTSAMPTALQRWGARVKVGGDFTKAALVEITKNRPKDYREHVLTVSETKELPTLPEVKEKARAMLLAASAACEKLRSDELKEDPLRAQSELTTSLVEVAALGDDLVEAAGGVRAALAAYRQAYLVEEGDLPLSEAGLEVLEGLVRDEDLELLRGLATLGAPTLQAVDSPPTEFNESYQSARAAAKQIGTTALEDTAKGRNFLVSSHERLAEARETISPVGAVPKKDAKGQDTGKVRAITEIRALNAFLAKHALVQRALRQLMAPPAVCPRIQMIMRAVVVLALRFPGVPLGGGKSDLPSIPPSSQQLRHQSRC
jgi:hypothetical protein